MVSTAIDTWARFVVEDVVHPHHTDRDRATWFGISTPDQARIKDMRTGQYPLGTARRAWSVALAARANRLARHYRWRKSVTPTPSER